MPGELVPPHGGPLKALALSGDAGLADVRDRQEAVVRGQVPAQVALRQLDSRADQLLEKRRWILSQKKVR